jgi:hypothetical protein
MLRIDNCHQKDRPGPYIITDKNRPRFNIWKMDMKFDTIDTAYYWRDKLGASSVSSFGDGGFFVFTSLASHEEPPPGFVPFVSRVESCCRRHVLRQVLADMGLYR